MRTSNTILPDTTMTTKGQVTIPTAIRRLLGLKPRDKVRFGVAADGTITVQPATSRLTALFGSVKPLNPPKDDETLRREFEEGVAEEVLRRI
jgi:antitoxin PrlF